MSYPTKIGLSRMAIYSVIPSEAASLPRAKSRGSAPVGMTEVFVKCDSPQPGGGAPSFSFMSTVVPNGRRQCQQIQPPPPPQDVESGSGNCGKCGNSLWVSRDGKGAGLGVQC